MRRDGRDILALAVWAAAVAAAGCSSAPSPGGLWALSKERQPTVRLTQSDVVALNEAVIAAADQRYEEAVRALAGLLDRFQKAGDEEDAAQTMFWLAYCYEKTGRKKEAAVFYEQLLRSYPHASAAPRARQRHSQLQFRQPPL